MSEQKHAPWPPGYEAVEVSQIDAVAFVPDGRRGVVLFTSTLGQKVCLVAPVDDLACAVAQIQANPAPGEPMKWTLRVIDGDADGQGR